MYKRQVCASVEYARSPDAPVRDLLTHHLLELSLYGCILWGITWLVLRSVLIDPVQQIFCHLYKVGGGNQSPLVVATRIREVQSIVEGVNVMVWRMERRAERRAIASARDTLAGISEYVENCGRLDRETLARLLGELSLVEQALRAVGQLSALSTEAQRRNAPWDFPK